MARSVDNRVGVSVNAETMEVLCKVRDDMIAEFGIKVSYTQAIQYLAKLYIAQKIKTHVDQTTGE